MDYLKEKWNEILLHIKESCNITDISFKTFLLPLEICALDGDNLYISSPAESNQMGIELVEKKYGTFLKVSIAEITGKEYNLHFILPKDLERMNLSPSVNTLPSENYERSNLIQKYTFETFVVGGSNRFAYTAALAVGESPGQNYNPLYIYGGPGLGKTHLLHSIGNYIISQNPNKKVLYVTSEQFLNEVIDSIRSSNNTTSMTKLRDKYRTVDVLMIDDIQFIIGKDATQEEFFHTFNHLHAAGKQIVLTSDKPPRDMETLESRIQSRFEWGLLADIGYPDYETRMAILHKKLEDSNIKINDDILSYIADNIKSNVREIEGALTKLIAYQELEKKEITMEIAVSELANIITPDKKREITTQMIIEIVADHYNISINQICSKNRSAQISRPRQIAMYLCKEMTEDPYQYIGNLLGGKDHSTVMHGYKKVADEYNDDEEFKREVDIIKKKINPNL